MVQLARMLSYAFFYQPTTAGSVTPPGVPGLLVPQEDGAYPENLLLPELAGK